jgi:predicted MFS family arabinose efflux permease
MVKPFLVDAGLGLDQVGWISGALGSTAGMTGSLLGGWGVGKLGRRRAMLAFGLLQAAGVGLYVLPALGMKSLGVIATVCALEHLAGGMGTVALFTLMMDRCRPGRAGTDYTMQASIVVFASGIASWLGGFTAKSLGWPAHFAVATALAVVGVLLVSSKSRADAPVALSPETP